MVESVCDIGATWTGTGKTVVDLRGAFVTTVVCDVSTWTGTGTGTILCAVWVLSFDGNSKMIVVNVMIL